MGVWCWPNLQVEWCVQYEGQLVTWVGIPVATGQMVDSWGLINMGTPKQNMFEITICTGKIITWSIAPNPNVMSSTNLSPSWTKQKNTSLPTQPTYLVVLLKYIKTGNRKIDHHFKDNIYIYPINDIKQKISKKKKQKSTSIEAQKALRLLVPLVLLVHHQLPTVHDFVL